MLPFSFCFLIFWPVVHVVYVVHVINCNEKQTETRLSVSKCISDGFFVHFFSKFVFFSPLEVMTFDVSFFFPFVFSVLLAALFARSLL